MRRPYLVYILTVVIPSAATIAAGTHLADNVWRDVRVHSEARAARMALLTLEHDLGATVAALTREATPTPVSDSTGALEARALAGDTANGLALGADGMEVRVALPAEPGDDPGTIRAAAAPLPTSAVQVGRTAGFRTALYLSGQRWVATTPPPGPESLPEPVMQAVARTSLGVPVDPEGEGGTLLALGGGSPGANPAFAVLAASNDALTGPLPIPLLMVMALLLLFAALAGWIQLTGGGGRATRSSLVLVSLVPALTAWGFLVHGSRLFHEALEGEERRDLTRALAVARVRDLASDPTAIHELSGFHAYRVVDGAVTAASLAGPTEGVARLPAPPPSFTSTGQVRTGEGLVSYVALRIPGSGFTVVTSPGPAELEERYDRQGTRLGLILAGWLLVVGLALTGRRRPVSA